MNLYHRINQFILERYPILWNTQFVWATLIGVLLHLIFFTTGFIALDLELLKSYSLSGQFFSATSFSIYIILCLIVFIFVAFRYFSHNPFKHFYPIGKGYFWKVFLILCFETFLYLTTFMSYENGMKVKANQLVSDKEITEDIRKVNKAYPFFYNDIQEYHITKRSWPKPFPLNDLREFTIGYDTVNHTEIKHEINKEKPFVTLNGTNYQFGVLVNKTIDSCHVESMIDHYSDISKIYGLEEYSLLNFSGIFFNGYKNEYYSSDRYLPELHRIFLSKSKDSIKSYLMDVKDLANRYHLSCVWDVDRMTESILKQNINDRPLIRVGLDEYGQMATSTEAVDVTDGASTDTKRSISYNYTIDLNRFKELVNNKESLDEHMGYHQFKSDALWVLIFLSMLLAFLMIIFKYVAMKEVLLGTVVTGIMISLAGLTTYPLVIQHTPYDAGNYHEKEKRMALTIAILCIGVLVNSVFRILSSKASKKWAFIFFVSGISSLFFLIPSLYDAVKLFTMKQVHMNCSSNLDWEYRLHPKAWHYILLYLPAIGLSFYLLKRLHSKPE